MGFILVCFLSNIQAQNFLDRAQSFGENLSNSGGSQDTLASRPADEDSLQLYILHPTNYKKEQLDSSLTELFWVYNMPFNRFNLGNPGTATMPIAFNPYTEVGFRMGISAFQYYLWNAKTIPYYHTDKPYSDLGYNFQLMGAAQQLLYAMHTQNIFPLWNIAIAYRSMNSLGEYANQHATTNNLSINTHFETRNRKYQLWAAFVLNNEISQENGGIKNVEYLNSTQTTYRTRSNIPVNLGYGTPYQVRIFGNPQINTGRKIYNTQWYLKQSYSFGQTEYYQQVDSIGLEQALEEVEQELANKKLAITEQHVIAQDTFRSLDSIPFFKDSLTLLDSTEECQNRMIRDSLFIIDSTQRIDSIYNLYTTRFRIFQSRFKVDHIFERNVYIHTYLDNMVSTNRGNNGYNSIWNSFLDANPNTINISDRIEQYVNQLAISVFPQFGNIQHYIRTGVGFDYFNEIRKNDLYVFGEYMDVTKNKKWVLQANAHIYLYGWNIGNYYLQGSVQHKFFSNKFLLNIGIEHFNRTAMFSLQDRSNFYLDTISNNWKKENTTHLYTSLEYLPWNMKLSVHQWLVANYFYFYNQRQATQHNPMFSVTQVELYKKFQILPWLAEYSHIGFHYVSKGTPVNLPIFYTIQRIAVENVFFKKFILAAGIETRFVLPYSITDYSPVLGQFVYANNAKTFIFPDVNIFIHANIRGVRFYLRVENLNTLFNKNLNFMHNTIYIQNYPNPNATIRLGAFINLLN
ncbi:MAG: putative porin [Chitinophagaceae bacterium]